jgi:hypothetical protein
MDEAEVNDHKTKIACIIGEMIESYLNMDKVGTY